MFFGRHYPYSNLHDLNLDWIISEISSLKEADAEALAAILEQGVSGDSFKWRAQENTLIVTDNYDAELYRVIWDDNGFTMSRSGGTPVTYRVANGTLTAPTINATALRAGSANVTGTVVAGEIHTTTPLAVQYGGTGADNAADARSNLGAMASDAVIPIAQGGTGATTAAAARTALGAMASDAVIPITQGGTGATDADSAVGNLGYAITRKDQASGTLVGLVGGRGTWLVTVLDSGDDTKYYVGVIFHPNNSTAPVGTTLANTGISFSYGNSLGTCIFTGATGNYIAKAVKLTE